MALAAASTLNPEGYQSYGELVVTSGVTIYKGALVAIEFGTGTIDNYNDEAGHFLIGIANPRGASIKGDGKVKCPVLLSGCHLLPSATVTGASAATKNGEPFYATDESTFTLTRPSADGAPVGIVLFWRSGTTADVLILDVMASAVLAMAGGNYDTIYMGSAGKECLAATASANLVTAKRLNGHGRVVRFYAKPTGFASGNTAGSQTICLEINGTNVSGSTITVNKDDIDALSAVGVFIAATVTDDTAIFSDGDTADVELLGAGGTAFAPASVIPGGFEFFADVVYKPGN